MTHPKDPAFTRRAPLSERMRRIWRELHIAQRTHGEATLQHSEARTVQALERRGLVRVTGDVVEVLISPEKG